ncbi:MULTISPECIES: GntR family transcriptional regulator [Chelativorans]|uniref:Transcriptional regulator, GntR family n=1 Tax=Chelativorans sp. (strain BNC1) TaxID=266779 RepID=Q11AJ4_CHESB|nr:MULTISPECIES: GntR family transcriptional regulator [Chelativorans]
MIQNPLGQTVEIPADSNLENIISQLEEDIVFGRLHQRERLIEDDLISRFGAKRHVIRQALAELEHRGLVERVPNRGASVCAYSAETVRQLYDVREVLELHAAKLIPLPLPSDMLDKLKRVQQDHDRAVDEVDFHMVFRSNIAFHRVFFDFCNNPFLAKSIDEYALRAQGIRFYALADPNEHKRARDEHHEMIAALEEGDRNALIDVCRRHLVPAPRFYIGALSRLPG